MHRRTRSFVRAISDVGMNALGVAQVAKRVGGSTLIKDPDLQRDARLTVAVARIIAEYHRPYRHDLSRPL